MWDQATQAVRVEIEKEADTIARLLVFEFSHLTELETQTNPDSSVDERVKRLLWEKVTFNEIIRGIELIHRQCRSSGPTSDVFLFPLEPPGARIGARPPKSPKKLLGSGRGFDPHH